MIKVEIKYAPQDRLFTEIEEIGFYTWEVFKAHFERLIKWKVPFEVVSINGFDEKSWLNLQDSRLTICPATDCSFHDSIIVKAISVSAPVTKFITDLNYVAERESCQKV